MTALDLARLVLFAGLGLAAGLAYFRALNANVRLYVEGGGTWRAALVHGLRFAAAAALFWLAAQWGAGALLAALGGFLGGRFLTLRPVLRDPC